MQLLLLAAVAATSLFDFTLAAAPRVSGIRTSSGIIIGHPASNKTGVTEFLGVRYAEAPVGKLRFAAPKRYIAPREAVFEASEWVSVSIIESLIAVLT